MIVMTELKSQYNFRFLLKIQVFTILQILN